MHDTRQDAFEVVLQARMGSLAHKPTTEYMEGLLYYIEQWAEEVRAAHHKAMWLESLETIPSDNVQEEVDGG